MVTATSGTGLTNNTTSTTKYPSMATASAMITGALSETVTDVTTLQDTSVKHTKSTAVGSATVPVYVAADGTATPITSYSGKAATAGTADTANSVAWDNVSGKPSTYAPANHASNKVTSMTGYAKADSAAAISTSDSLNTAIGKLEKALDGKQASGSYVPTSRTVNSKALSSNVTLTGADVAVTGYSKPSSTGAIAATDTVNAAIGKLEKALDGKQASGNYLTAHQDISGKENTSNKVTATSGTGLTNNLTSTSKYPSMATASQMITDAIGDGISTKQDKSTADYQMGNASGSWTTMTSAQQNALNSGVTSTKLSNAQNKIPSGSEGSTTLASIWVE
ncbi:MAG: hypothetical protein J6S74_02810, partial [Alphaproteobacteria bacterium]|nr:hypothetical protein [Alphaproteobacteria bacterium]